MKANQNQLTFRNVYEKLALILFMMILLFMSIFSDASAQRSDPHSNDPHFPARHEATAGLITTYRGTAVAAPVLIGEFSYGISNRFSAGIVGGTTGTVSLVGGRMAARLFEHKSFRLLYRMNITYYPERNGTYLFDRSHVKAMPWILSMGFFDSEWRMSNGVRASFGVGMLETHCVDGMMNLIGGGTHDDDDLPFDVFNTAQAAVSIPLSGKLTLRPETIMVFKGTQLVSSADHKVQTFNIYVSLIYHF